MKTHFLGVLAAAICLFNATTAHADYIIAVSVDTSQLTTDPSLTGPFGIDFELLSGGFASGNTATIRDFNFGGGSPNGAPDSLGGIESGSLSSTVTLSVTPTVFSDFNQGFTPGSTLSFQVDSTANLGSTPDAFSLLIFEDYAPLDQSNIFTNPSTPIPTQDPTGSDTLVFFQITPNSPTINTYGGSDPAGDPPTPQATVVPEPSTLMLSAMGLASLGLSAVRRQMRRRKTSRKC